MKKTFFALFLIPLVFGLGCKNEVAQWRGPDRNGIYQETGLLDRWPEEGPEMDWIYKGTGRGYAAPAVTKERVYVNGENEGLSYLMALDLEGNLLWKSPNGEEFVGEGFSSSYPGARSTPTVMGNLVYATSGKGRIACFETASGIEIWAISIVDDLDGQLGYFGYSESVAVDEDHLYCFPGGVETNVAALDRFTGETVWRSEVLRDTFAYGSPVLVDLPERKILITTSWHHLFAVDRSNGKLMGSYMLEGKIIDGEHCNTPVFAGEHIYFVSNDVESQGAIKLLLSPGGENIVEAWRNPEIRNNFGGLVVVEDQLFTTVKGNRLVALGPENGKVVDSVTVATGSLIYADNKFFCYGNNGAVNLVSYKRGELENRGNFKITQGTGHHFSHPVISRGRMYIRRGDALMAYMVASKN